MKRKRLLADAIGFASLVPIFLLYDYLEERCDGYIAVMATVAVLLPISAVWHHFYAKYSD